MIQSQWLFWLFLKVCGTLSRIRSLCASGRSCVFPLLFSLSWRKTPRCLTPCDTQNVSPVTPYMIPENSSETENHVSLSRPLTQPGTLVNRLSAVSGPLTFTTGVLTCTHAVLIWIWMDAEQLCLLVQTCGINSHYESLWLLRGYLKFKLICGVRRG